MCGEKPAGGKCKSSEKPAGVKVRAERSGGLSRKGNINIGASGWDYDHWSGPFYPENLKKKRRFDYYAERFDTVEINNTFYRMPGEKTLRSWRDSAPEGFTFSLKASRYITHMKKLKEPRAPLDNFHEKADLLGNALGPVLLQLPPKWKYNGERLEHFLSELHTGCRYCMEFRDTDWFRDETYEQLERAGVAFCIYEIGETRSPRRVTANFVYIRLHGPDAAYQGRYSKKTLAAHAGAINTWLEQGKDVYCYFDNDQNGYAPLNAMELKKMID